MNKILLIIAIFIAVVAVGFILISSMLTPPGPGYNLSTFLCIKDTGFTITETNLEFSDGRMCSFIFSGVDQTKTYFLITDSTEKPLENFLPAKHLQLEENCPFIIEPSRPTIFVTNEMNEVYSCHNELGQ